MSVTLSDGHGRFPSRVGQPRICAVGQEHCRGVHGERLLLLHGSIPLGVDGMGKQRHTVLDLVRVCPGVKQLGQSLRVLVLDCMVRRGSDLIRHAEPSRTSGETRAGPLDSGTEVRPRLTDRGVYLTTCLVPDQDLINAPIEVEGLTSGTGRHVGVDERVQKRGVLSLVHVQLSGEPALLCLVDGAGVMGNQTHEP